MKYLIFGGSGFIGIHLTQLIKKIDPESKIYNLDVVENNHDGQSIYIYCDVREKINLEIPISEEDIIFNLAAIHKTPGHPNYAYFETNINGAENICEFARNYKINKILFTSSIAPYGASEELKTENTLPMPNTPYGISKLVAEKIHMIWQIENINRTLVIVRPGVVFGKGENGNFTRLYWSIRKHRFFYPGRKDTIKAAIYVKDLVNFMLFQVKSQTSGYRLFNCTYEPAYTIEQIVECMAKVTGLKPPYLKINAKLMLIASKIIGFLGGKKLGIHPERVKKLMISTNICGYKMVKTNYQFRYTLEDAIKDWHKDNDNKYLL
ncbi:NAD(P)-dependent oxidoreductase [Dysgonomonas sp. 521]|uniref:NAD-dependent epimerase/dehydratase family protein n=1 Tax=Dysgonomonas sp. 521 TaxID=2302932 RepID=UPI0013CF42D9|nr:NAD(P)-dependent oxidoreductase [Dysgonomonas sp. 521]NDV96111.1 NAD(P)-dependent oxidoreductase [Dysgonomonas sp. 521]